MIVFFEVSVLLAASIFVTKTIEHKKYSESKGLVNKSKNGKIRGITSFAIEKEAERMLETALKRTIEDGETIFIDRKTIFEQLSTILDTVQRNLNDSIASLDRLKINQQEVTEITDKEVYPMYEKLYTAKIEAKKPTMPFTTSRKFIGVARDVYRESTVRFRGLMKQLDKKSIVPDEKDLRILAEAISLKRNNFKKDTFYIASLDNHFCGKREPYEAIPGEIERKFEIKCRLPIEILANIETELGEFPKAKVKV